MIHEYILLVLIYSLSAIPYALSAGPGPGPALPRVRGPQGRPSEGPGGPPTDWPRREGPAREAEPAPGPTPPIGHRG